MRCQLFLVVELQQYSSILDISNTLSGEDPCGEDPCGMVACNREACSTVTCNKEVCNMVACDNWEACDVLVGMRTGRASPPPNQASPIQVGALPI